MRIPLNPCDYHFFVLQRDARRAEICRFIPYLGYDLAGHVDGEGIQKAIRESIREEPALAGGLRFTALLARPYWRVEDEPEAARHVYQYHDLRSSANWPADADRLVEDVCSGGRNVRNAPVWRFHHIEGPEVTRVLVTWPHMLMDAEGAESVLASIDLAYSRSFCFSMYRKDASDPLAGISTWRRIQRTRAGLRAQRDTSRIDTLSPPHGEIDADLGVRYQRRFGRPDDMARIKIAAKKLTPLGPALYSRHLAACTLRALKRLYDRKGWKSPNFAVSFPMKPDTALGPREMHGNNLISLMVHVPADIVADWRRLGECISTQILKFRGNGEDLNQCAVLWAAGLMRPGQYHRMMRSSVAKTPIQSGFSYFETSGPISIQCGQEPPPSDFLGRSILRAHCGGIAAVPPGWNPVFWRYGDQISMTLAWPRGYLDDALSVEYADLIESEALSPSD